MSTRWIVIVTLGVLGLLALFGRGRWYGERR
jgi:hypothetical protein